MTDQQPDVREALEKAVRKAALQAMHDMLDDLDKAGTVPCLMGYYSDRLSELESLFDSLSTSPLLDKNDQAEGAVTGAIADRIKAIACKDIISVDDKHRLLEISLSVRVLLQGKSQPPQPDSNELVELRRDAERWRYCVSRGDFPKRPIKAATGQQSAGWLYKVSEFRVWFDSAGEAADAALAQSPSKKGGE